MIQSEILGVDGYISQRVYLDFGEISENNCCRVSADLVGGVNIAKGSSKLCGHMNWANKQNGGKKPRITGFVFVFLLITVHWFTLYTST